MEYSEEVVTAAVVVVIALLVRFLFSSPALTPRELEDDDLARRVCADMEAGKDSSPYYDESARRALLRHRLAGWK